MAPRVSVVFLIIHCALFQRLVNIAVHVFRANLKKGRNKAQRFNKNTIETRSIRDTFSSVVQRIIYDPQ